MSKDARIGTLCPQCGEVELGVEQVWLVVATVADFSHYGFHCPGCGDRVHHAANADVIGALSGLVPVEELDIPAEVLEHPEGPAINVDDLLDLMLALDAAWELAAAPAS